MSDDKPPAGQFAGSPSINSIRAPTGSVTKALLSLVPGRAPVSTFTPSASSFLRSASSPFTSRPKWSIARPFVGACAAAALLKSPPLEHRRHDCAAAQASVAPVLASTRRPCGSVVACGCGDSPRYAQLFVFSRLDPTPSGKAIVIDGQGAWRGCAFGHCSVGDDGEVSGGDLRFDGVVIFDPQADMIHLDPFEGPMGSPFSGLTSNRQFEAPKTRWMSPGRRACLPRVSCAPPGFFDQMNKGHRDATFVRRRGLSDRNADNGNRPTIDVIRASFLPPKRESGRPQAARGVDRVDARQL